MAISGDIPGGLRQPVSGLTILRAAVCLLIFSRIVYAFSIYYYQIFDLHYVDYGEGSVLGLVNRLEDGRESMRWIQPPIYTVTQYGPAYIWLTHWVSRLFANPDDLTPGRAVNFCLLLLMTALIVCYVGAATRKLELGLFAGLMFIVAMPVAFWNIGYRVDLLAVTFSLVACMCMGLRRWGPALAALAIVAGSITKSPAVFTSLPIVLCYLARREYRNIAIFALTGLAVGATVWTLLIVESHGYYLLVALSSRIGGMIPWRGYSLAFNYVQDLSAILCLLALVAFWFEAGRGVLQSIFAWAFVCGFAIQIYFASQEGSNLNYFIEVATMGAVLVGRRGFTALIARAPVKTLILMAALTMLAYLPGFTYAPEDKWHPGVPAGYGVIASQARGARGPILADAPWIDAIIKIGGDVVVNDSMLQRQLIERGTIKLEPFLNELESGRIPLVVFDRPLETHLKEVTKTGRWHSQVLHAIEKHYEQVFGRGDLYIYRFKAAAPLQEGALR